MKRLYFFAFLLTIVIVSLGSETIQKPRGFVDSLYRSTLALYGTGDSGIPRFLCTTEPFEKIPGGYHLFSAGHCVQFVPADVKFSVAEEIGGPLTPVTMLKARYEGGVDFSEFALKTSRSYSLFVIGDERNAHVGDAVISPNFAAGLIKQLSLGVVSSDLIPVSAQCSREECAGEFLVQIYGAPGMSGSAVVLAHTHEVIGIVVSEFGAPVGFGVEPISLFSQFLASPTQPHPVESEDK